MEKFIVTEKFKNILKELCKDEVEEKLQYLEGEEESYSYEVETEESINAHDYNEDDAVVLMSIEIETKKDLYWNCTGYADSISFTENIDSWIAKTHKPESVRVEMKREFVRWVEQCTGVFESIGYDEHEVIWVSGFDSDIEPVSLEEYKNNLNN